MYLTEELQNKWEKILDHPGCAPLASNYKRSVITVLLENQEEDNAKQGTAHFGILAEAPNPAGHNNAAAGFPNNNPDLKGYDPILISLLRRALPNLMAFDTCGVQPMKAPTGLIFALKSRYTSQDGAEALHNEADTQFSGTGTHSDPLDPFAVTAGGGLDTPDGEELGTPAGNPWPEMAFSIDKVTVEAKTRALKAEYTIEIAQDLKAVHGLDAEAELANILSAEILAEINREIIRKTYQIAVPGAQNDVDTPGEFDLDVDSNGRWFVEKVKGLMYQIERDANAIAKETRRGRGNFIICDSDTASALSMAGLLDIGSALKDNLNVDDTGNTFVGVLNGRFKVFIDPYAALGSNYYVVGYKGSNAWDAGLYYCPYVPLQMVRAVGEDSFQPKIGFKTRYGLVVNPFSKLITPGSPAESDGSLVADQNVYYRKVKVLNLL